MRLLNIKKNFSRTEKKKTNIDRKASLRRKQTEKTDCNMRTETSIGINHSNRSKLCLLG